MGKLTEEYVNEEIEGKNQYKRPGETLWKILISFELDGEIYDCADVRIKSENESDEEFIDIMRFLYTDGGNQDCDDNRGYLINDNYGTDFDFDCGENIKCLSFKVVKIED